jgi:D-alanyl-D-alanine carboxypeptidase
MTHRHALPLSLAVLLLVAVATVGCGTTHPESSGILSGPRSAEARHEGRAAHGRPADSRLDPDLLDAVRAAARDMQDDGVRMTVTSGWRSREHQQRLFDEAVMKYGSEEEALRYVATPDTSAHVTGDAVDLGPTDALSWLSRHGDHYGLCQTFANEMWHYELATTPGGECPPMLPDGSSRS